MEALLPDRARTVTLPRPGSGELGCVWSGTCSHDCPYVVSPCGEVRGLHKVNLRIRVWVRGPATQGYRRCFPAAHREQVGMGWVLGFPLGMNP